MWYNPMMSWLLRSPLHGMFDREMMLVSVTGRKSGRTYSTPVNYLRQGNTLWVTSTRQRTWWRNLAAGAPVELLLAGHHVKACGWAITDERAVVEGLTAYFEKMPQYAKYYNVALDATGHPVCADVEHAARERVVIRIDLS